jgi:GNAT superfamily N-acetyltransferase
VRRLLHNEGDGPQPSQSTFVRETVADAYRNGYSAVRHGDRCRPMVGATRLWRGTPSRFSRGPGRRGCDDHTMAVIVRRGELADASVAADLWLRARRAAVAAIPPPTHTDDEVRSWFSTHVARELELWVAESEHGGLLGILVLDGEWIDQLYVDPANTGCGIGLLLLDVAKRERPNGVQLWTFVSNRARSGSMSVMASWRSGAPAEPSTKSTHPTSCTPTARASWCPIALGG